MSALFAQLVLQQTNMAMMLMGRVPHPESGQTVKDLDSARFFIDQLEMLETKTKGNLTKDESALLKQSLTNLRLAFVKTVDEGESGKTGKEPDSSAAASPSAPVQPEAKPAPEQPPLSAPADEEHKKKFSKKY